MPKFKKTKKKQKRQTGKILLAVSGAVVLLAAVVWLISLVNQWNIPTLEVPETSAETRDPVGEETMETTSDNQETTPPEVTEPQVIDLSDGLVIHTINSYAGIYMEDGTDEPVADVLMIILENTAAEDLQLARISIEYDDFIAEFEVTNLPAGEKAVVLEKNRQPEPDGEYQSIQTRNVLFFPESMSLQEDRIQIEGSNGMLKVTNTSGEDITGDIYVYYKNSAADLLYGGITYRVAVKGGLEAGESASVIAGHYTTGGSRIVQVDCGN